MHPAPPAPAPRPRRRAPARAPARVAAPVPPPAMGAGSPTAALAQLPPKLSTELPAGAARSHCPRCGHHRIQGHGSFRLQDGTRKPRYRCQACGRTFNPDTGTPLAYIKKRHRWPALAACLVRGFTVRRAAAVLGVRVATAFAWRHRLLGGLVNRPQPAYTGTVAAGAAFIRYSEKGRRQCHGPGSWGSLDRRGGPGFRRFVDGRPSCVVLASAGEQQAARIAGQGRPDPEALQRCLAPLLGPGCELWSDDPLLPFALACRGLGIPHRRPGQAGAPAQGGAVWLCAWLHRWLRRFHGVATRYLGNYLVWFLFHCRVERGQVPVPARALLTAALEPRPWEEGRRTA